MGFPLCIYIYIYVPYTPTTKMIDIGSRIYWHKANTLRIITVYIGPPLYTTVSPSAPAEFVEMAMETERERERMHVGNLPLFSGLV